MPEPTEAVRQAQRRYWRSNVKIMSILLSLWALVGLGCGILFADTLNDMGAIGGVPLGFWFAQQGSIITFVFIILFYAITMNRLDAKYHRDVKSAAPGNTPAPEVSPSNPGENAPAPSADDSASASSSEGGDA